MKITTLPTPPAVLRDYAVPLPCREHSACTQNYIDTGDVACLAGGVPLCAACLASAHTGAEPDFPHRLAVAGEACGAADHDVATASSVLLSIDYSGRLWSVEHADLGFRVVVDGKTAPHNLSCNRVSTLQQAFAWLAEAML
jgi:hypothetical protein